MRLLKTRKSEKSISDLDGFTDICNEKLSLCIGAHRCADDAPVPPPTPPKPPVEPEPYPRPSNPDIPSGPSHTGEK